MPSTIEQLNPTRVKLTVEIPFADLKPTLDQVYKEISQQVQIPGFRKGKVPAPIIDQRIGRGAVLQDAINDYLPTAFGAAIEEHNLSPLGQPEIEITKLEDGQQIEFTAELDIRPEFEVPGADTLEVSVDPVNVTDEQVQERLELMRERFATLTEVDREAAQGDQVTISLTASQNGEELADASAQSVNYVIGSGGMLEGMDEAVTGKKAGEETNFTSTLVGGGHKDEEAEIKVSVEKVQERKLPEVDDDFAQLVSQFDTVEEMMDDIRSNMENIARLTQLEQAQNKALEQLIAKTEFDLPEAVLNAEIEQRKTQITQQLTNAGLTLERYLKETDFEEGKTEEEFWATIEKQAQEAFRAQLILDKLTEDQNVDVSQQELLQLIYQKAIGNNSSPEKELQHMMEHNHQGEWMQEVRRGKVLTQLIKDAKVTDSDGNVIDVSAINPDGSIKSVEEDLGEEASSANAESGEKAKPAAKKTTASSSKKNSKPAGEKTTKKTSTAKSAKEPAAKKATKASANSEAKPKAKKPATKAKAKAETEKENK